MADLNNTIVRGELRVTEDINANGNITGSSATLSSVKNAGILGTDSSGKVCDNSSKYQKAGDYVTYDNASKDIYLGSNGIHSGTRQSSDGATLMGNGYWITPSSVGVSSKLIGGTTPSVSSEMTPDCVSISNGKIKLNTSGIVSDGETFTFDGNPGSVATSVDINNLQTALNGKANSSHTHSISQITNLQTSLDGKAPKSHTHSISQITNLQSSLDAKLDKTTYEWNKEFAAGSNGAISLGRYNIYDSQLTFDITSTTNQSISGKLVIATQNGTIHQAKVFGDATGALVSKLIIYQSAISNSRSWVEVFCNFNGWSKNKVHIYAVALNSATVQKQMTSVSISNGVPAAANVTSGDTKWTGTIVNDFNHSHGNYVTTNTAQTISGVKTFSNSIILPPKNAIMLGTGADGKIYDNTDFYNRKLDGIVINDMTETDIDGYYCFRKGYHSKLTQHKTLTGFLGHANVLCKGGRVSNNNTKFVGFGEADGYPWFGFIEYDRDYSDVADAQLVESYGITIRKGVVAGHSSAYIIDGGASTDKETRLVTEDELAGKANVGHTHAISEITNLQSTLNGKANASHTHTISQINTLQDALDRKQATLVSGTNIRTINGTSILGGGDIPVVASLAEKEFHDIINSTSSQAGYAVIDKLLIQWGVYNGAHGDTTNWEITYPKSFWYYPAVILQTKDTNTGNQGIPYSNGAVITGYNGGYSFTFQLRRSETCPVYWIAIGGLR